MKKRFMQCTAVSFLAAAALSGTVYAEEETNLSGTVYAEEEANLSGTVYAEEETNISPDGEDGMEVYSAGSDSVEIDEVHFPDGIFREYVAGEFDVNSDGVLSEDELNSVVRIQVGSKGISDLSGIEYFVNLNELDCYDNKLAYLDVSKNINLSNLICFRNQLTDLDVSQNTRLSQLMCGENQLSEIDVTQNLSLSSLACDRNFLNKLDVSHNLQLGLLYCQGNQLTDLNVSLNTGLRSLFCDENQLEILDLSQNAGLSVLRCGRNQLKSIVFNSEMNMDSLMCEENLLTDLDLKQHADLRQLACNDNQLKSLDVSDKTKLTYLECGNNQLTSLDVSNNPLLYGLLCSDNALKSLDVSNNPKLRYFWCANMQLTDLDVSQNKELEVLWCSGNQIKELDVSRNTELYALLCSDNQLSDLDVSNNIALDSLLCDNNQLSKLELKNNTKLGVINCQNNHLPELNTEQCKLQDGFGVYVHGKLHYDYDNVLSAQSICVTAYQQNKQWVVDLSKQVSADRLAKVSVKEGNFDTSTGIWTLPEGTPSTLTYSVLTGKKLNKSEVEEDLYMDVTVNVAYMIGGSNIVTETDGGKVTIDVNALDTAAVCKEFNINAETAVTKILIKQTEAKDEDAQALLKETKSEGNTLLDTYDVNMVLYVDDVEKGQVTDRFGELTLSLSAGTENKGKTAAVYQLHGDKIIPYKNLKVDENGMVSIKVTKLSAFAVALQTVKIGDIDGNGEVNLVDLMMCLNHVSKKKMLEGDALAAADIDGKDGVTLVDLMRILNYVSKKSTVL